MATDQRLDYFNPETAAAEMKAAHDAVASQPSDPHSVYSPPTAGQAGAIHNPGARGGVSVYVPPAKTPPAPTNPAEASRRGRDG
jgi:hypothetical protein